MQDALYFDVGQGPVSCWFLLEVDTVNHTSRVIGTANERFVPGRLRAGLLQVAVGRTRGTSYGEALRRMKQALEQDVVLAPLAHFWRE